jgi:hypothetical protein
MIRCYFNLVNSHEVIRDETGVEVSGAEEARVEAMKAINEWRQKESIGDWDQWKLNATDPDGNFLFSIPLRAN